MRSFYEMKYETLFETIKEGLSKVLINCFHMNVDCQWWTDWNNGSKSNFIKFCLAENSRNIWGSRGDRKRSFDWENFTLIHQSQIRISEERKWKKEGIGLLYYIP